MQAELMSLHPLDRLEELNELLAAATRVGGADVHQLRVLLALTFDALGRSSKALEQW
jgi:hypothetical protein